MGGFIALLRLLSTHMKQQKKGYGDVIEGVRSTHRNDIKAASTAVECPKCGTRQVVTETPGMRYCFHCGFEFRPLGQRT